VVRRALRIGFTLAELVEVLKARDSGGVPCHRVYKLAQEKLKGITEDIEALRETQRYLKQVLGDWGGECGRLLRGRNQTCCTRSPGPSMVPIARLNFGDENENDSDGISFLSNGDSARYAILSDAQTASSRSRKARS
jgi:hypothetical protein